MPTVTLTPYADATVQNDTSYTWSGVCEHICGGYNFVGWRSLIKFSIDSSGWTSINGATLRLRNNGTSYHGSQSGTRHLIASRMTSDWDETGNATAEPVFSSGPYSWQNRGNAFTTQNEAAGPDVNGTVNGNYDIDVTQLVKDWVIAGAAPYGFMIRSSNESGGYIELKSRQYSGGSLAPQLIIDYNTNQAPYAPVNTIPANGSLQRNGLVFNGQLTDPDPGDHISAARVQIFSDAGGSSLLWDSGSTPQPDPNNWFGITCPTLTGNRTYYWKSAVADTAGAWGPWGGLQSFIINNPPPAPSGTQPNGVTIQTLTPYLTGTSADPDPGDYLSNASVSLGTGGTQLWASGASVSGSSFSVLYSGPALSPGTTYWWYANCQDSNGEWGATGGPWYFTTYTLGTPTNLSLSGTKINTTSVTFSATLPATANAWQYQLWDGTQSSLLYDSSTVGYSGTTPSASYSLPSLASKYTWRCRFRDTNNVWSSWSSFVLFWANYSPTAGQVSPVNGAALVTTTPAFVATFSDTDKSNGFNDAPSKYEVEVSRVSDSVVMYTLSQTASLSTTSNSISPGGPGVTQTPGAGGNTLSNDIQYRWRARYTDNSAATNAVGPWSTYLTFKPTVAPRLSSTISGISVANPTVITTTAPHGLSSTNVVEVQGSNCTPSINGRWIVTVTDATHFTIPVQVTGSGSAGTVFGLRVIVGDLDTGLPTGKINKPTCQLSWVPVVVSGGKSQKTYRVQVLDPTNHNASLYDSGTVNSSSQTMNLPAGVLTNNKNYLFWLQVTDVDDLASEIITTASYLTLWTPPAAPTGLGVTVKDNFGYVSLSWDQSTLNPVGEFDHYSVYRRKTGDSLWVEVATIKSIGSTTYSDYATGFGVSYDYKVSQWKQVPANAPVESSGNPATSTFIDSDDWFLVVVGRDDLSFSFIVDDESHKSPFQMETFEPYGRNKKVIVRSGIFGREGDFSMILPADERPVKEPKLRAILALNNTVVILKNPFGDFQKVFLNAPDEAYQNGGHLTMKLSYVEVS